MELVLGHLGPEWRQFQYLMAQRLRIVACKGLAAPAALRGLENLSVIGWEEGPLPPFMPGLAARFTPRNRARWAALDRGQVGGRRSGGVGRVLVQSLL